MAMTAAVMANANSGTLLSFQKVFRHSLMSRSRDQDMEDDDEHETDREEELSFFRNLRTLGWIRNNGLLQQPLGEALHGHILKTVRDMIAKEYEENLFQKVQLYKDTVLVYWLEDLVGTQALESDSWSARLDFSIAECFCLVRMEEIFDLVAEYPDSHVAVLELRAVLERTKMHHALGKALKKSLVRRLNHPGANTSQIIDVYINTIKVSISKWVGVLGIERICDTQSIENSTTAFQGPSRNRPFRSSATSSSRACAYLPARTQ